MCKNVITRLLYFSRKSSLKLYVLSSIVVVIHGIPKNIPIHFIHSFCPVPRKATSLLWKYKCTAWMECDR